MRYHYHFPKYVSVAEKKAKAEQKLKQLKKKNPALKPVTLNGNALATTWWGKEWNKNLERYADYTNRIGRGRSYVRHGAVLDLTITPGKVEALVQGSRSKPYSVVISIRAIPQKNWHRIKAACKGKMESMQTLISGKFPKGLADLFTQKGDGLFPCPEDISFDCSCPDWAAMCKHVAAVLYGIGARLDEDPNLFFVLRKADTNDLISEAIQESKNDLLAKARRKTSRVLEPEEGLSDIFGIDLDEDAPAAPIKTTTGKNPTPKRNVSAPKKQARKKAVKKPARSKKTVALSPSDVMSKVEALIKKGKTGIKVSDIIDASGLNEQNVRNSITRLKQLGRIESAGWGVYRISH
ncbi:MAG: hypothetical protein KJ737_27330 [Proteobacteria bacterium]|nr:hypothetical protein [Pseudomonadota bacterium]